MLSRTQETPISPPPRPNNESHESRLRACLIVLGGICNFFATFGFVNTWGVFQAYYEAHFKLGSAEVAWIGSIQYASLFLPGLIAGRLVDQAIYRVPLFVASVTLISMTFLIGSCTMYWQLLLAQGICSGICCGIIFGPTTAVVAQWFHTHRALALGLVACGSSLGGIVVPTLFEFLLLRIGFTWAMRSLALLQLLALGISNLTLRLKLSAVPSPQKIETVDAFSLKTPVFLIYCASALCTFLGSTTMIGYLTVDALAAGVSKNTVTFLLAVMNASSAIGRISSGLVADRFGALKVLIPFTGTAAVITYLWPFAHRFGPLAAIAICYGFSSGAYVTLCAIPVMSMNPVHTGQSIGMLQMCMAIGALVGTPISGIIHDRTKSFEPVGLYAGSMLALAAGMMLITQLVLSHQRPIHKS